MFDQDHDHNDQETSISYQSWRPQSKASQNSAKTNYLCRIGSRCFSSWKWQKDLVLSKFSNKDEPTYTYSSHKDDNLHIDHKNDEVSQPTSAPAENAPVLMDYYVPPYPHAGHDMVALICDAWYLISWYDADDWWLMPTYPRAGHDMVAFTITVITTTITSNVSWDNY